MSELKKIQAQKNDVAFKKQLGKEQILVIEEFIESEYPETTEGFNQFLKDKEYEEFIPAKIKQYPYEKLVQYAEFLDNKIDALDDHFDNLEEKEEVHLNEKDFCCFTTEELKDNTFKTYFNAAGGKSRRNQRRAIRKKKREEKRAAKKAWKAAGKKGGHKEWLKIKKQIKKKEREELAVYGGTFGGRLWRGLKKYNPALVIARNAALGLIKINFWNVATHISKAKEKSVNNAKAENAYIKALTRWGKFGGNKDSFEKAVNVGKNKKPIKISFRKKSKRKKFDGAQEHYNMADIVIAGLITAGGSIIVAILNALKGTGDSSIEPDADTPDFDDVYDSTEDTETGNSYQEQYDAIMNDPYMTQAEKEEAIAELKDEESEVPQWVITTGIVAGVLAGLGLITWGIVYLVKKNKAKTK